MKVSSLLKLYRVSRELRDILEVTPTSLGKVEEDQRDAMFARDILALSYNQTKRKEFREILYRQQMILQEIYDGDV